MSSIDSRRTWLDRYEDPRPIRSRGAFCMLAARRTRDARPCVVMVPGPAADVSCVEAAFLEIQRIHALVDHPRIPPVTARGRADGVPFLELECDAVTDGVEVLRRVADAGRRLPCDAVDGWIVDTRDALAAAHAANDPRGGGPVCIGRLSHANYLFAPDGRWFLVGLGRNFPTERETGAPDVWTSAFQSREVACGLPPSPTGDRVALRLLLESLLPYVDTAEHRERYLRGDLPSAGPGLATSGCAGFVAALLAGEEPRPVERTAARAMSVLVGPELAWIAGPGGERRPLGRAQRRILAALIDAHRRAPTAALTMWDLLAAGWPGERPVLDTGANRVYVTVARMRRLGLREVIEHGDDGYRLAPRTVLELAD